ncbi:MAG TPA: glycoside hydrolase family 3 protein [Rectinemataceae bacterium]|nr:glycoside hydrolase family 3 protein [Rectinemataceae bacterium]
MKGDVSSGPPSGTLAWKIGQMLVVGFGPGEEGLSSLGRTVDATLAGNVILFSRNTPDAETSAETVAQARAIVRNATGFDPLVAIDQEGGIVMRLRKGVVSIPGAMAQAAAFLGGGIVLSDIERLGAICGADLAAVGVNWNLAPVVDVNVNPKNPVIGVRSYGEDPAVVADLASAFARGLRSAGVMATAKHFPGHGDATVDSHLSLPLIPHGVPRLEAVELLPFRRLIAEGIGSVMTAHALFPAVEPEALPATLSSKVIRGLLREKLGYGGLVCSDCMEMKAIAGRFGDPYVMAVKAGVDLILISHTPEKQREAAESIRGAVERGDIPESRIDESVERILAAKAIYCGGRDAAAGFARSQSAMSEGATLAARISRASLTSIGAAGGPGSVSILTAKRGILLDVAPTNLTGVEDGESLPSVASALAATGAPWSSLRLSPDPDDADMERALSAIRCFATRGAKPGEINAIAMALFAPLAHEGQTRLVARCAELAGRSNSPLILALMRSPYDAAPLVRTCAAHGAPDPIVVAAYEYTGLSASSVADFLAGRCRAEGACPVKILG